MNDVRTNLSRQVMDEVKRYFGAKVYRTIIPRNIKLGESPSFGLPILYYDLSSSGAISYIELACEIINQSHREMLSP